MIPPPHESRVSELFAAVVNLPAEERARYLDVHCPDADLRAWVEALLAAPPLPGPLSSPPDSGQATVLQRPPGPPTPLISGPRYDVLEKLGEGGMGVVYRAFDRRHRQPVALKVVNQLEPARLIRFKQEFHALAGYAHPNLVTLYDLADGPPLFFTMELVEGVDFLRHVRSHHHGPLGPAQVERLLDALRQLAEGIAYLHDVRMLHRDIKPSNVLVTRAGRVVLLDFGLVAELDPDDAHRSTDAIGTPAYMAPEQAAGERVGPAGDWYAVGVLLYEALTGQLPFTDTSRHVLLLRKWHEDPPDPRTVFPDIPADLAEFCLALLRRDPHARPNGRDVLHRLGVVARPVPVASEVRLVGRVDHLQALGAAFETMRQGRTVVVGLHGPSGVGKTALLRCFLDQVAAGGEAVVLRGRCYEQESVPSKALGSLIDALARYLAGLSGVEVRELLPTWHVRALARLFPVLDNVDAVAQAPLRGEDVLDGQELRGRAVAALRELLERLGTRRPLILAIDDLQWGDHDSAALLGELLPPRDSPPLLLLGSYRSEDAAVSPCITAFRQLLQRHQETGGRDLAVGPLSEVEQRELARALLSGEDLGWDACLEQIVRQSDGYPFFVIELVRHLKSGSLESPRPSLQEVVASRVRHLPEEARRLLEVVAAAGQPIGEELACRAADIPAEPLQALARLRAERLIRRTGPEDHPEVETYHDRIRETVRDGLAPEVRRRHHRRLAEELETAGGCDPEVLAVHFEESAEPGRAGRYFVQAAEQAAEALAFDRAARLYQKALELLSPAPEEERTLRIRRGDALALAGRGKEAARDYLAAASRQTGTQALELQRRAALQLLSGGYIDEGLETMRRVLTAVGLGLPANARQAVVSLLWLRAWVRGRELVSGLSFRRRSEDEIPPEELAIVDACLAAAVGLSMVEQVTGAFFQVQALVSALQVGEPRRLVRSLALFAQQLATEGLPKAKRVERLLAVAEDVVRQGDEASRPYLSAVLLQVRGFAAVFAGDWPRGLELSRQAEGILRTVRRDARIGMTLNLNTVRFTSLWALHFLGEMGEMACTLPGLIKEARERDDLYAETNLVLILGTITDLCGDRPERAREELRRVMGRWSRRGFHIQHLNHLHDEAQIDIYQGQGRAAWERLDAQWKEMKRSGLYRAQIVRIFMPWVRARAALAALPQVAHREPFLRDAEANAAEMWRQKAPWGQALAQMIRAGVAAARGHREEALTLLADAAARCDATAMKLFAACCRRQLGLLQGDAEGVRQAEAFMDQQAVARPGRFAGLALPGFGPSRG